MSTKEKKEKQELNFDTSKGISAAELVKKEFPEPKWAIPKILPEGLTVFAGKPKRGKSICSLNLGLAIASGGKAFGDIDVEQGTVLCFSLEDPARRLQYRIKQMLVGDEEAPEKLILFNQCPRMGEGGLEEIGDLIKEHPDARLVIIDTLAKFRPKSDGSNKSSYNIDYQDVGEIKDLADEHNISIMVVHHLRKLEADDVMDTLYGSFGLTGAADGILVLDRMTGEADANLHITGRDVEEAKYALKFQSDNLSWQLMGDACEVRSTGQQQKIVDTFKEAKTTRFSPKQIAEATGLDPRYIKNTLPKLLEAGVIKKLKYGVYAYADDSYDSDDSSDHDDSDDTNDTDDTLDPNDSKDLEDTDDSNDSTDPDDSSGATKVIKLIRRSKRRRT